MPDFSIIIPIYNVEKYLRKCIEEILAQTHKNFELILINDGSVDNCGIICDEFKKMDARIKVIHQKNQGTGQSRNNGLAIATGKYIYFCDPDDSVIPSLLADNLFVAEKYQANMVVFGYSNVVFKNSRFLNTDISSESKFLESQKEFRDEFGNLFQKSMMYTLWNKIYRREFLNNHKCMFSNQKVGQDTLFNYKVYESLDRVYVNDKKSYYFYFVNRNESATNVYRKEKFEIRYEETIEFERLLAFWGYQDRYDYLIINDWMHTLYSGINDLFNVDSPYKESEKKVQIQKIIYTPKIQKLFDNKSITKQRLPLKNLEIYFLRNNLINLAFYFLKIKRLIKGITH